MSSIFGGSKSKSHQESSSWNEAYPFLKDTFGGMAQSASGGSNLLNAMLGIGGQPAQTEAFDNYRNSSGYNFIRDEGVNAIEGSQAAKGLLRSGSTLTG